jgi:hypothetical protein
MSTASMTMGREILPRKDDWMEITGDEDLPFN